MRDITIKTYPANIQVWVDSEYIDISTDGWSEFNYDDNMAGLIDHINETLGDPLQAEEVEKITFEVKSYVYDHSIECYE